MYFQEEEDYTKQFDPELWRRVFHIAYPYRFHLLTIASCMVVSAAVDVALTYINRTLIDNHVVPRSSQGLPLILSGWVTMIAIQGLLVYIFIRTAGQVEAGVTYDIRSRGFKKLQELSFSFFDTTSVGFLMARMAGDAQRIGDTIGWVLVDFFWGFSYIIITAATMLLLEVRLATIVLAVIPFLVVISLYFQRIILASFRAVRRTNSKITSSFNEGIMGGRTTKSLGLEERHLQEFQGLTGEMRQSSLRAAKYSALFYPVVSTLGAVGAAFALTQGGRLAAVGSLSLGTLVVFLQYAVSFFDPVREIARIFAELQSSQAAAERVITLLETEPEIKDTPEVEARYGDNFAPKRENWEEMQGAVTFQDVTFRYKNGETVLEQFNLEVAAGETIALVGETGSGKSTIVNLVCRFYEPSSGTVLIDGRDVRERSQLWLQSNLGYVLQQPHLFAGTIRENIRYGRIEASDPEVEEAARLVYAEPFILEMEEGYETPVGEGGGKLSTGEKQLVSFARAMLANPRLFVLDEATSSVDTETELLIQRTIQKVLAGRTSFVIAHRLSTVRSADRILVIAQGKIIEEGNHQELMRQRGHYYTLYTNQFLEERQSEMLQDAK
ncbi:MAG: ABC transporter ATP-binding protein/permease [Symbiobacteriaceae bacterium]|nr:ABC transporter ATP-binding protein/permease [Symbiobacteriaceae bacterium]